MSIDVLLPVLSDGEYHSGEELGDLLGVSRAAVWKQLKKLEDQLSVRLESTKGKGYRLVGGLELLQSELIQEQLSKASRLLLADLQLLSVTDSTNRRLVALPSGAVCVAERQTAGRGRRGRAWHSPYGKNLYFSLCWEFSGGAAALEGLSLAVGVVIVETLAAIGIDGVSLKWPNDLLWRDRKLAGILLEMTGDASGICQVVVGVGINVSMAESGSGAIDQPWVDLETIAGHSVSRNELLGRLLDNLLPMLSSYEQTGFSFYRQRWQAFDAFAGQPVRMLLGQGEKHGVARGVDVDGALLLEHESEGLLRFNGGEISVRKCL